MKQHILYPPGFKKIYPSSYSGSLVLRKEVNRPVQAKPGWFCSKSGLHEYCVNGSLAK